MLFEMERRGHENDAFDQFGLLEPWHGVIPPLEFLAGQSVAIFQKGDFRR
jgi:hypothetical protein